MLVTNHVLSGAVLGHLVPDPVAAFALGVASHLVLDAVPHWGVPRPIREVMRVAVADGLVGAAIWVRGDCASEPDRRPSVLAGMAGAAFLDLDKPSCCSSASRRSRAVVDGFHRRMQRESPRRMPQEVLVGLTGAVLVAALTRRHARTTG